MTAHKNDNPRAEGTPVAGEAARLALDDLPVPYIELDRNGNVIYANKETVALHAAEQGALVGMSAWSAMPIDQQEQAYAIYVEQLESKEEPPVVRRTIYTHGGKFRIFELHRRLIRDAQGNGIGMVIASLDLTDTVRELDDLRNELRWHECALAAAPTAVLILDVMGFVRHMNPAAERLLGWSAGEIIGDLIEAHLVMLAYETLDGVEFSHARATQEPTSGIATVQTKAGNVIKITLRTSPVVDHVSGSMIGIVSSLDPVEACH